MPWTNSDGLVVKFGTEQATAATVAEYSTLGRTRQIEAVIDLTSLATGSTVLSNTVVIPNGARIERVQVHVQTAATSGGSAALNIGLIRTDGTTAYDADGLVAAMALTSLDAAGETNEVIIGHAAVGALVGTTLANDGLLVADYDTAAFTAGRIRVIVHYFMV